MTIPASENEPARYPYCGQPFAGFVGAVYAPDPDPDIGDDKPYIWLIPYGSKKLQRYDPDTGEIKDVNGNERH